MAKKCPECGKVHELPLCPKVIKENEMREIVKEHVTEHTKDGQLVKRVIERKTVWIDPEKIEIDVEDKEE